MSEAINRRKFIRNSLVLASCVVIPAAIDPKPNDSDPLERLIAAISHQCAINDAPLSDGDIQAMTYAYDKIKPQNHLEYTVVTACSTKYVHDIGLTDEYVRRKDGKAPKLFYHPAFDLEKRCMPNTHGLLLFRDQALCLLQELTSTNTAKGTAYYWELIKGKFSFDDFVKAVNNEYKEELGINGMQDMYDFIYSYSPYIPYSWHSTIVSRAGL
jgi:hypothetical protein